MKVRQIRGGAGPMNSSNIQVGPRRRRNTRKKIFESWIARWKVQGRCLRQESLEVSKGSEEEHMAEWKALAISLEREGRIFFIFGISCRRGKETRAAFATE